MKIVLIGHGFPELMDILGNSSHTLVGVAEILLPQPRLSLRQRLWRLLRSGYRLAFPDQSSWEWNAKKRRIPFFRAYGAKDPELAAWLRERGADLFLDYASPLLPRSVFGIPPLGTVNIHPALLPKYRGPNPLFWMIYDMERQPGVTIHFIDEGMDTGPVLVQGTYSLAPGSDMTTMRAKILTVVEEILVPCLDALAAGTMEPRMQPAETSHPVARKVRAQDYQRILQEMIWEPERLFHFLHGTRKWLDLWLRSDRKIQDAGVSWSAAEMEPIPCEGAAPGSLIKTNGRYYLAFPNCQIRLKRQRSLKTVLKDVLLAKEAAPQ